MALHTESREDIVAEIKDRADIVEIIGEHVNLKRSGVRYLGICPFHHEKTPSFSVHSGQQFYHCFGCKESGDVFSFMMKYHNLDFPAALKALAQRYQIELPERTKSRKQQEMDLHRDRLFALNEKAAGCFRRCLVDSAPGAQARRYLEDRGIGKALQERYQLGYAPAPEAVGWNFLGSQFDSQECALGKEVGLLAEKQQGGTYDRFRDRVIFPIFDSRGRIAGFGGRILGNGNPKYLNSPESVVYSKSRLLFGLFHQRDAIRMQRRAVLVEGNFDLLALVAHGLDPVVAPLGTALTREQVRILKPLVDEVVLLFDGDEAGVRAVERSVGLFLAEQVSGRVAVLPPEHDPDTFVREYGLEALHALIDKAETLPEFVLDSLVARHGLTLDGKGKIIEDLKPLLAAAASVLQRSVWASHFAKILGVEPEAILEQSARPAALPYPVEYPPAAAAQQAALKPVSGPLKAIVTFMVLHPEHLPVLEESGLAEMLAGTIGEVILLQLRSLRGQQQNEVHPEDLLTALPAGEERSLVASLLLTATEYEQAGQVDDHDREELEEIREWLKLSSLKRSSDHLIAEINDAQKNNDFSLIAELMQEKMRVDSELKKRS